jgi:hypothetical protein
VLKLRVSGSSHSADDISANLIAHRIRNGKLLVIATGVESSKE